MIISSHVVFLTLIVSLVGVSRAFFNELQKEKVSSNFFFVKYPLVNISIIDGFEVLKIPFISQVRLILLN